MKCDECLDSWSGGGWVVFIVLNHQTTVGEGLLSMGAPDTVWCAIHVTQPLGFTRSRPLEALSSSGTGQSGATPDKYCSLSGAPLTAALLCRALFAHCSYGIQLLQATVVRSSRCSASAPDSPVAHRTVR
jgi:hypothetical protein